MKFKILIYIGLIVLLFYLITPVPYCKITENDISQETSLYTTEEIFEVTNISVMLLNVKGTSMLSAIQDNSECLCVKKEKYFVGDIIFFFAKINGEWNGISHRIFLIDGNQIFPKGDNNDWVDPPMTKESIVCMIPTVPRWKTLF